MAKKSKTKTKTSQAELSWQPKKTFELKFTIPWEKVKDNYQAVLKQLAKEVEVKGFRKGKAPLNLVEKKLDQQKVYQQVLKQLLPDYYGQAVKKHQLKPAVSPRIEVIEAEPESDWTFKAISCELPEVDVSNYQKIVKGAKAQSEIWTPKDGKKEAKQKEPEKVTQTKKLRAIFKALLEEIELELPDILVEEEVNRSMARLLGQVENLGITMDQYLQSNQLTAQKLRERYAKQAQETMKLELILQALADKMKLEITQKELDDWIKKAPDEKTKKALKSPAQTAYLKATLRKQRVIDRLLNI